MSNVIVDLDGTLADSSHRIHMFTEHHSEWDWDAIKDGIKYDGIREEVLVLVKYFHSKGFDIYYLTSRNEEQRSETEKWLTNTDVPYKELIMRENRHDWRPDLEFKIPHIKRINPSWIIDDRPHLVKFFRDIGYRVIDVGLGYYDNLLSYESETIHQTTRRDA